MAWPVPAAPSASVIAAAPLPAAGPRCSSPGRVRRRDLPGLRSRPADEPGQQAGYLPEAMTGTRAPAPAGAARTLFRTTAMPTARLTTNPARGGLSSPRPRGDEQVTGQQLAPGPAAAPDRRREIVAAASSGIPREAPVTSPSGHGGQTLTRARPLRRRAARTARPALVRMRSRKPCVLARRRLFGWNVRLLTGELRGTVSASSRPHRRGRARSRAAELARGVTGSVHGTRRGHHWSNQAGPTYAGTAAALRFRRETAVYLTYTHPCP